MTRAFRTRPLRRHLLQLSLLGLLPLAVLAALGVLNTINAYREDLRATTIEVARAVAGATRSELDSTINAMQWLSYSQALGKGDYDGFRETALATVRGRPGWADILLADNAGRAILGTNRPSGAPPRLDDEESLDQCIALARPIVGRLVPGEAEGTWLFAVRVPEIRDAAVQHVLTARLWAEHLKTIVERQQIDPQWIISVLDSDFRVVARSRNHERHVGTRASDSLVKLLGTATSREGAGTTRTLDGDEVVTGFAVLPGTDWVVAVGAPSSLLASSRGPALTLYLLGVGASLLICVVLAVRLAGRLTREIDEVATQAFSVGSGAALPPRRSDIREIDALGEALGEADRKLNEANASLRAALDEAKQASRAKDQFLAVLGHELRNPLAPIVSVLYLLDMKSDDGTARERQVLKRQVEHMRRLVDDLLDVSRIARGKIEIAVEPLELVQLVAQVVSDTQQAGAPGVEALTFTPRVPQAWVDGDAARLAQVFGNLVGNAVRYGAGNPVAVELDVRAGRVEVLVRDQGIGIAPDELPRVFEAFYQAPQPEARTTGGLGLGLAIVKAIVGKHGGTVTAQSAGPGQGSTFRVELPLR